MKRITAIVLMICLFILLLHGCGEENNSDIDLNQYAAGSVTSDGEWKISNTIKLAVNPIVLSENAPISMKAKEFPLISDCAFFALATTDEGYVVYGQKSEGYSRLHLDSAFNIVKTEDIALEEHIECLLPAEDGESYAVHSEDRFRSNGSVEGTYTFLQKEEERLYDIPWPQDFTIDSIFAMKAPEGLYVTSGDWMILDGKRISIPSMETENGAVSIYCKGFLVFGESRYAVFRASLPDGENDISYIAPLKDGKFGIMYATNMSGSSFWHGNGYAYYIDDDILYRTDGKSITPCGDLLEMGINQADIDAFLPNEDKVVLLSENRIILLEDSAEQTEGDTIVVGGMRFGLIQDSIATFNRDHHTFKVVTKQFGSISALNLALVSKEVDIIYGLDASEMEKRARGGLFLPMDDFVDLSPMYPNVVLAGSVDDVCYMLPQSIMELDGMLLPREVLPERGYFLDMLELDTALSALGSERFYKRSTKEWMLDSFGKAGFEEWIDWNRKQAAFEDENFIHMLEICNRFAKDATEVEGNQYSPNSLFIGSYQLFNVMELKAFFEVNARGVNAGRSGDASVFPEVGCGKYTGLSIRSNDLIAVPVGCPHPDEVGELLKYIFSVEEQKKITDFDAAGEYSAIKALSEEVIERRIRRQTDGTVWGYPMTEEELKSWQDKMKDLLAGADHYVMDEGPVREIVKEESLRYFEGFITAEKAAAYIQNRVQLYLDEQG